MATHSSILAWEIPWTEESGGLQPIGSQSRTRLKRLRTRAPTRRSRTAVSKTGTQDLGPGSHTPDSQFSMTATPSQARPRIPAEGWKTFSLTLCITVARVITLACGTNQWKGQILQNAGFFQPASTLVGGRDRHFHTSQISALK